MSSASEAFLWPFEYQHVGVLRNTANLALASARVCTFVIPSLFNVARWTSFYESSSATERL